MAKIDLPKRSGKRSKVREKSVKSQGILNTILSGNPVNCWLHIQQCWKSYATAQMLSKGKSYLIC